MHEARQKSVELVKNGDVMLAENKEEEKVDIQMDEVVDVKQMGPEGDCVVIVKKPTNAAPASTNPSPTVRVERSSVGSESSGERSVSEGDYDCEGIEDEHNEIVEESVIKQKKIEPVSTSPTAGLELFEGDHAPFSWSEEVERSYLESLKDASGMENGDGYDNSESPGLHSQNSEVSSQDSGRATGGLASSLSPMDDGPEGVLPQYEFEIPNTLVGLVIGIKGKTIKELSVRTEVKMLIRPHHTPTKSESHQICQVRGKRDQINKCLCMLRRRFPPARFPDLNLQPVLPPPLPNNLFDALHAQPTWLTLPEEVPTEVVVSSLVDPGHVFIQQPTHPSFSSLNVLDRYMLHLYSQQNGIPELPKPCETGLLCAAPVLGAWFRAVTVLYYADSDEVLVRFVDYGGYTRVARGDIRQIRTDLMTLPFQAIECYLAHVQPVDGTWQWGDAATDLFKKLCMGKVIEAHVVGYHVDDRVPFVELSAQDENGKVVRVDRVLMEAGVAKASDPSKVVKMYPPSKKQPSAGALSHD